MLQVVPSWVSEVTSLTGLHPKCHFQDPELSSAGRWCLQRFGSMAWAGLSYCFLGARIGGPLESTLIKTIKLQPPISQTHSQEVSLQRQVRAWAPSASQERKAGGCRGEESESHSPWSLPVRVQALPPVRPLLPNAMHYPPSTRASAPSLASISTTEDAIPVYLVSHSDFLHSTNLLPFSPHFLLSPSMLLVLAAPLNSDQYLGYSPPASVDTCVSR